MRDDHTLIGDSGVNESAVSVSLFGELSLVPIWFQRCRRSSSIRTRHGSRLISWKLDQMGISLAANTEEILGFSQQELYSPPGSLHHMCPHVPSISKGAILCIFLSSILPWVVFCVFYSVATSLARNAKQSLSPFDPSK